MNTEKKDNIETGRRAGRMVEIRVPLPATLHARLVAVSKKLGVTPSKFVSLAMRESMERERTASR